MKKFALMSAVTAVSAVLHAQTQPIFSPDAFIGYSSRSAGNSPLGEFTVSSPIDIYQIGVQVDLNTTGNLSFLIYDETSSTLLLDTAPASYGGGSDLYDVSAPFSNVTLNPGDIYAIGAIADQAGNWDYGPGTANTQNGITQLGGSNANVYGFSSPLVSPSSGGAGIPVGLYGTPVPEPSTIALAGIGIVGIIAARRRK